MLEKVKLLFKRMCLTIFACLVALTATTALAGSATALPCANCGGEGGGGGGAGGGGTRGGNGYFFVPIRITTYDVEDAWPDWQDEPSMYYGDGADKVTYRYSTWAGDTKTDLPAASFTGSTITVDLWERDNGWTDRNHLGQKTATITQLGQEAEFTFAGNGYSYTMRYKVVRR